MLNFFYKQMRNKKGFTLIELIVVLAILGMLAAIGIPRFTQIQRASDVRADASVAQQICHAARIVESNTGTAVDDIAADIPSNVYVPPAAKSGGTFAITGGGPDPYEITFEPAGTHAPYDTTQTVTEGETFTLLEN